MRKLEKDGKIAVAICRYAGWITEEKYTNKEKETLLMDKDIVEAIINKVTDEQLMDILETKVPSLELKINPFKGSMSDEFFEIEWVTKGTKFWVEEYDCMNFIKFNEDPSFIA